MLNRASFRHSWFSFRCPRSASASSFAALIFGSIQAVERGSEAIDVPSSVAAVSNWRSTCPPAGVSSSTQLT